MERGISAPAAEVEPGWLAQTHQLYETPRLRKLAVSIGAVWLASLSVVQYDTLRQPTEAEAAAEICGTEIECYLELEGLDIHASVAAPVATPETTVPAVPVKTALPPETTTTLPPPPPPEPAVIQPLAMELPTPVLDSRVEAAIDAVTLTPEGYVNFLNSIDFGHYEYAQTFPEFNPALNGISQDPAETDYATWHFTVIDTEVPNLARGLATRGDDTSSNHICCAVNNVIDNDPDQIFYQLAPWEAHLSHNPPDDSSQLGTEVMSASQADITTVQYEKLSYWTIAVAKMKGWLGVRPMADYAKGHGEVRDVYKAHNPHSRLGVRDDFNYDVAERLRQEILEDLTAYPELMSIDPALR